MVSGLNICGIPDSCTCIIFKFHQIELFFHLIDFFVYLIHGSYIADVIIHTSSLSCNIIYIGIINGTDSNNKYRYMIAICNIYHIFFCTVTVIVISISKCNHTSCTVLCCYTFNSCVKCIVKTCHITCNKIIDIIGQCCSIITEFLFQTYSGWKWCQFHEISCVKLHASDKIRHYLFCLV